MIEWRVPLYWTFRPLLILHITYIFISSAYDEYFTYFCHLFWFDFDDNLFWCILFFDKKLIIIFNFSTRRFPGYSREGKKFDANVHRQHIFGLHVAKYMTSLKEENPDAYGKQFSRFVKAGIQPTSV
jgi:hypothetical protein